MKQALKPYPEYKDSGLSWLGEVPEHWEVRRLKHVFQRILGGSTPSSSEPDFWDGDVIWITPADVSKTTQLRDSLRRITLKGLLSCSTELVPQGSLIMTSRAPVGNVSIAEVELCTNQGCKALVLADEVVNPIFGFHVLNTLKGELQSLASGTTFTEISTSKLGTVSFPLPPHPEQAAIVRFLDHYDRKIRRYIHAKKKLIKLLEEQKQAIIHHAVTRGLDPNVPLKPSNVDWLGDVPQHWEIRRIYSVFRERNEKGQPDLPILAVSIDHGVTRGEEIDENGRPKRLIEDRALYKVARKGDIAYNMMRMWQGAVGVVPEDGLVSPAYVVARPGEDVNAAYFAYLFRTEACKGDIVSRSRGIADDRNRLYWGGFKEIHVPFPPYDEQNKIVDLIEEKTDSIERSVEKVKHEIVLLREYRTRLIADVVTGKLDVTGIELPAISGEAAELEDWNEIEVADAEEITNMEEVDDATD